MLLAISSGAAGYTLPYAAHASPRCTPVMAEAPKIWTPDDISWTPKVFGDTNDRDLVYGPMTGKYCEDLSKVIRRKTRTVTAGPVKFGSEHPIVRQTMGTTSTKDVKGTIDQVMRCADEGFGAPARRRTLLAPPPPSDPPRCVARRPGAHHGGRHEGGDGVPRDP